MRTTRTTAWVGGAVVVALLTATATWLLLVGPRQDEAASLREQAATTATTNDALAGQVQQLELQLDEVPATRAEVERLREQVPADAALPDLLRQLSALADRAGAELTGVTPTEPVAEPTAVVEATPTSTATSSATAAPTDAAATPAPAGTTDPATDAGVEVVPVTIAAEGTFAQVQELLRLVQVDMERAVLVRGLTMTAGESGALQLSLTAEVFTLPGTDAEARLAELASSSADDSSPTASSAVPTDGATPLDAVAAASGTPWPTSVAGQTATPRTTTTQTTSQTQTTVETP